MKFQIYLKFQYEDAKIEFERLRYKLGIFRVPSEFSNPKVYTKIFTLPLRWQFLSYSIVSGGKDTSVLQVVTWYIYPGCFTHRLFVFSPPLPVIFEIMENVVPDIHSVYIVCQMVKFLLCPFPYFRRHTESGSQTVVSNLSLLMPATPSTLHPNSYVTKFHALSLHSTDNCLTAKCVLLRIRMHSRDMENFSVRSSVQAHVQYVVLLSLHFFISLPWTRVFWFRLQCYIHSKVSKFHLT